MHVGVVRAERVARNMSLDRLLDRGVVERGLLLEALAAARVSMPGACSTLPLESATVTSSGVHVRDARRDEVHDRLHRVARQLVPPVVSTSTAARRLVLGRRRRTPVGAGSSRFTVAAATPSIASIVLLELALHRALVVDVLHELGRW